MWKIWNPRTLFEGMKIDATTMENSMKVSQKSKITTTILSRNPTCEYLSKRIEIGISER